MNQFRLALDKIKKIKTLKLPQEIKIKEIKVKGIKEKRHLIIALCGLIIIFIFHCRYVAPLREEVNDLEEQIESKMTLLQKYKKQLALYKNKLPKLRAELNELKKEEIWLKPQEPYKLAAYLEKLLKSLVDEGKLEITNYQILPERKKEGFKEIKIRFEIKSNIKGVTEALFKIENVKGIYISELTITKLRSWQKFDLRVRLVCTKLYVS